MTASGAQLHVLALAKAGDPDVTLAQGRAPTLKAAKDAVVMGVARRLYGLEPA